MLVVNLIWTAHGISIGQLPQIVTSALSLCCTVPILYLMARELQRHLVPVLLPALLAAGVLIAIDQLLGSAAFGAAAIIAAVVANAGQSIELVRAKRIVGVSVLFLILAVVNQGLWLSWAILVPDIGTMIFATVTGIITVFNLTWWSLRMLGLGPLFAARLSRSGTTSQGSTATVRQQRGADVHSQTRGVPLIKQSVSTVVIMFGQRSSGRSRLTRLAAPTLAVLLGGGCASTDLTPSAGTDPVTPASTLTPSATPTIKEAAVTDIRITVNDQIFTAQLADNPT
ncbi:MAG TPA: hypothetical protein VFP27_13345, partial [Mycobacterium sp.]|nr:hypothetical protein [Mycobacterium sp.]